MQKVFKQNLCYRNFLMNINSHVLKNIFPKSLKIHLKSLIFLMLEINVAVSISVK